MLLSVKESSAVKNLLEMQGDYIKMWVLTPVEDSLGVWQLPPDSVGKSRAEEPVSGESMVAKELYTIEQVNNDNSKRCIDLSQNSSRKDE